MDNTFIVTVVLILVIFGAILGIGFYTFRRRSKRFHDQYGTEYARTVQTMGGEKKAQKELHKRQKHIDTLDIRPLTDIERGRYQEEWAAVQSKFVDEPGKAIVDADHLITEVMQLRDYPLSDFDQRAADISIKYPALVSNYRAAREIAIKNKEHKATTEEMRKAIIYYRSLFKELVGTKKAVAA